MKKWRLILFPFGFLYGVITAIRNFLFDTGIKEVFVIPGKSVCVGNLSVGGTGKTPHIAYLADLLQTDFKVQILSRGYGRKTKGYFLLDEKSTSKTVGDEPLFYYQNFKKATVAVCESRKEGIQKLQKFEKSDVILLDDAFQHRAVKAGINIQHIVYLDGEMILDTSTDHCCDCYNVWGHKLFDFTVKLGECE